MSAPCRYAARVDQVIELRRIAGWLQAPVPQPAICGLISVVSCPRRRPQGALLLDFLAEPLYIDSVVVASQARANADSSAIAAAGDEADAAHAAEALRRALVARTQSLGLRLDPPFRHCQPVVVVVPVLPSDSCFRPTASRRVPSGAPFRRQQPRRRRPSVVSPYAPQAATRSCELITPDMSIGN